MKANKISLIGAFIKVKDAQWAPVVEFLLGDSLFKFICANDSDAQVLNRLVDQVMDGNAMKRPKLVASSMTGRVKPLRKLLND